MLQALSLSAQDIKEAFQKTGASLDLGGGAVFSMMPSRMNKMTSSSYGTSDYYSFNSFAFGVKGEMRISPFSNDHFGYFMNLSTQGGWLGAYTQSEVYVGHQFRLGMPRLKLVVELGKYKVRRALYSAQSGSYGADEAELIGRSYYDGTARLSLGGFWELKKGQSLQLMFLNENYTESISKFSASGFSVSFATKNKVSFSFEMISAHPSAGDYLLPYAPLAPNPFAPAPVTAKPLSKDGLYINAGIKKTISFHKVYREAFNLPFLYR